MLAQRVCIIGAGSSGMVATRALHEAKIPFDCFEKGSNIGGNWLYNNDNGMSSAYQSLHINTSKQLMAYQNYPMPDYYPDYPGHQLIHKYFESYTEHFGLRDKITFNTSVEKVEKLADHHYRVSTNRFPPREYTDVIIANGHHWSRKWADFDGKFTGSVSHSHDYKSYQGFEGKKVLIVGIGNSAVDIACELTTVAQSVTLSTRSGAYILPKYLFGRPTDHLSKPPLAYIPLFIRRIVLRLVLKLSTGNQANFGFPAPKRPILSDHPTISQDFLNKVGHGMIHIKPNIKKLDERQVIFEDGSAEEFDHIIYCTGYNIDFPFFDNAFFNAAQNELPLYQYVVDPHNPGLYFIGFIQAVGSIMPLAELQAFWVAKILKNESQLPTKEKMLHWIHKNRQKMDAQYKKSSRHTIQVEFFPYKRQLNQLIKGK